MDPNTANFLGRIEGKVDQLNGALTTQGQQLARHDERIGRAENDIRGLLDERTQDRRQGLSLRVQITLALAGPVLTGAIGLVMLMIK